MPTAHPAIRCWRTGKTTRRERRAADRTRHAAAAQGTEGSSAAIPQGELRGWLRRIEHQVRRRLARLHQLERLDVPAVRVLMHVDAVALQLAAREPPQRDVLGHAQVRDQGHDAQLARDLPGRRAIRGTGVRGVEDHGPPGLQVSPPLARASARRSCGSSPACRRRPHTAATCWSTRPRPARPLAAPRPRSRAPPPMRPASVAPTVLLPDPDSPVITTRHGAARRSA